MLPAPGLADTAPGLAPKNDGPKNDKNRLQFAYKLDTNLVHPLLALPSRIAGNPLLPDPFRSLAARNLKRAYNFELPSGRDIARAFGDVPLPADKIEIRTNGGTGCGRSTARTPNVLEPPPIRHVSVALWLCVNASPTARLRRNRRGQPRHSKC